MQELSEEAFLSALSTSPYNPYGYCRHAYNHTDSA
jgi:hypothetical protein